jgi:hypothetical protein
MGKEQIKVTARLGKVGSLGVGVLGPCWLAEMRICWTLHLLQGRSHSWCPSQCTSLGQ